MSTPVTEQQRNCLETVAKYKQENKELTLQKGTQAKTIATYQRENQKLRQQLQEYDTERNPSQTSQLRKQADLRLHTLLEKEKEYNTVAEQLKVAEARVAALERQIDSQETTLANIKESEEIAELTHKVRLLENALTKEDNKVKHIQKVNEHFFQLVSLLRANQQHD